MSTTKKGKISGVTWTKPKEWQSTNHVTGQDHTEELREAQKKVSQLCQELHSAELLESLVLQTATIHILRPQGEANGPVLGSIISVEVILEEHPVKALLDTGSPVTIASIECVLDTLAKQRAPKQSVEEWKQEVQKKFQEPTLSVNNYGGGDVNVIGQLPVTLQVENKECQATILVQKGAKVDLLLRTDLISDLGFLVLEAPDQKGQSVDLLKRKTFAVNQSLVKEAGSVAGSCNTSSITKENSSTNTLTQSKSKDGMSESEKSEQRKTEEATQGSSTGVSKKVTEEGGRADLKVVSQIALYLLGFPESVSFVGSFP